jgi:MFS transporter, MHS family, shikimate and dehydroshikimate transport protein
MRASVDATTLEVAADATRDEPHLSRILWSSILGTAVEWYDFLIYAVATALVFNKLFFPSADPALSNIIAFGTYGVGFLARPLGAAVFARSG